MKRTLLKATVAAMLVPLVAGCSPSVSAGTAASVSAGVTRSTAPNQARVTGASAASSPGGSKVYSKVLVIVEENKGYNQIIGSAQAPYLNRMAQTYGSATAMDAGYPPHCPSLAAYILMTSGTAAGICDDRNPVKHQLTQDNIFRQVVVSGRQWRSYAEDMPANCSQTNSADGRYLVRHVPAAYYLPDAEFCRKWAVPLGSQQSAATGSLSSDLKAGSLQAYSMVTPNACNDMHGAAGCESDQVGIGDRWLAAWMPQILASPDYQAGRLVVMVTWDEGTLVDNHIPTVVISPTTTRVAAGRPWTHCSSLRTAEEILGLPLLGCAAGTTSMRQAFGL